MNIADTYARHASTAALSEDARDALGGLPATGEAVAFGDLAAMPPWSWSDGANLRAALVELEARGKAAMRPGYGWHRTPASVHLDIGQFYIGGRFWTVCDCGSAWAGDTPDDADAAHLEHQGVEAARLEADR